MVLKTFSMFAFCVAVLIGSARGDIIFGDGNSPANQNVKFTQNDSTSATGQVGTDDVLLATADTGLTVSPGGTQLEATSDLMTSLVFVPIGLDWEVFELNPTPGDTDGTFVLRALDEDGNEFVSGTFALDNGENRVWAQAINGQTISQLTIEASGALIDSVGQVRISSGAQAIPEPSYVAIAGIALAGLILVRRKRKNAA